MNKVGYYLVAVHFPLPAGSQMLPCRQLVTAKGRIAQPFLGGNTVNNYSIMGPCPAMHPYPTNS